VGGFGRIVLAKVSGIVKRCGRLMRYQPIDASLYIRNRERLREMLPAGSLVIVHSNDLMPTNADAHMAFKQNTDLLYLSGVDQEESIIVLFPDAVRPEQREILFVRETSEQIALWEGEKLSKERATAVSGIENVRWSHDFDVVLRDLIRQAGQVYLPTNEHARSTSVVETANDRFIKRLKHDYPLHRLERLAPLMHRLRVIKEPLEVDALRKACEITEKGFRRVLGYVCPGVGEWEVEAEYLHEFVRNGSRGFAYPPIIGVGHNACVLHYLENHSVVEDGQMLLMDVAAEWANYNADMTRTIPVSGRFSDRQRQVYDSVLRVLRGCEEILRPGILPLDYQSKVLELMELELIELGLIGKSAAARQGKDKELVKKYFPHGTSHHLGLDVHDVCPDNYPVDVGMVFTIEPGIYIREEKLGIRLENNYLIGEDANENLMAGIPIEADDIEALMAG